MLKEYDVPKERCVQDLLALLADLERNGLVVLT
jgi:hypothetical protein